MPYDITREPRGMYKRFWGVVTAEEFLASVTSFHSDPLFEYIRYTINDFSAVEYFSMHASSIEDTVAVNLGANHTNSTYRILAITVDPVILAMARQYDKLSQLPPILDFPTLADARQWLQVQE